MLDIRGFRLKEDFMKNRLTFLPEIVIIVLITLLLFPILIHSGWLPDDTYCFLSNLKYRPFGYISENYNGIGDRFMPLAGSSAQLLALISFKPQLFFLGNFIIAFLSIILLVWLFHKLFRKFWYFPLVIIITPAFSRHFYLIYTHKELLFLWPLFLALFFIPLLKNEKNPPLIFFLH